MKSVVATRENMEGVDASNFLSWAHHFLRYTQHLRQNGRNVLLIYDGYRADLSLPFLDLFAKNNVIVIALLAHSSG